MGGAGGAGSSLWDGLRVQDSIYGVIMLSGSGLNIYILIQGGARS